MAGTHRALIEQTEVWALVQRFLQEPPVPPDSGLPGTAQPGSLPEQAPAHPARPLAAWARLPGQPGCAQPCTAQRPEPAEAGQQLRGLAAFEAQTGFVIPLSSCSDPDSQVRCVSAPAPAQAGGCEPGTALQ